MKTHTARFWGILAISFLTVSVAFPQKSTRHTYDDYATNPRWVEMMEQPDANFFDIREAFNTYWLGKPTHRGDGYKPFRRWEYYWQFRVNPDGSFPAEGKIYQEYNRFAAAQPGSSLKSGNASWVELGPKTRVDYGGYVGVGRLNAIACHPTDTSIVFAGAPSGGLWKSADGGRNWVVLTDHMPSLGVSSLLIHPAKPDDILVGTGDRDHGDARGIGVIHSSDGGHTWQLYNEGMGEKTVGMMDRSSSNPDFILAATNRGIYKSTNGGASWEVKYAPEGASFKDIKFKPGNHNVAYATSTGAVGFHRTEDAGENWVRVADTSGLPNEGRMVIGVSPAADNLVYVVCGATAYKGCFVSQDNGKTFMTQSTTPNILGYESDGSDGKSQAWYDLCIFVDPVNASVVHVGGINIWRSDNGGKNWKITGHWTGSGATVVHADQHCFFYNPVNKRLYNGNDGGIYYTDNKGTTWIEISEGLGIGQIYRLGVSKTNPYIVATGFQDNGSASWTGTEWLTTGGGDGMESAVDPTDYLYSYSTLYYGTITQLLFHGYNRQVGGKGFGGIDEDGAWVTPFIIHEHDGNTMIAGYKNVWVTNNLKKTGSISWKKISNNLAGTNEAYVVALEQSPVSPTMLYFSRADGRLFRTDDFTSLKPGWTDLTNSLPTPGIPVDMECHPFDPETVYILLSTRVFKSADRGETWTDISGNLPDIWKNTLLYDESSNEGLYVGTDAGTYYKDATMTDWVFYNTKLPKSVDVSELDVYYDHLDRSRSRLRASTFGRGLWETPLAASDPILPPTFLEAAAGSGKVNLYWNVPFYPQYVTSYRIYRNGIPFGTSTGPSYTDDQLESGKDYVYHVTAVYANSTESAPSNKASVSFTKPVALPYTIDFEPGTGGWKPGKINNGWIYSTSAELGISGNDGHFFGIKGSETIVNNQVLDCLISPTADLSGFIGSDITLSFDYCYLRSPNYGKFDVVYRISPDSVWTAIQRIEPADANDWRWSRMDLVLPKEALSATTQIGFLFENHGTPFGGAGIDNVSLSLLSSGATVRNGDLTCRVFPNPSSGQFQLELSGENSSIVHIRILNLNGQEIRSEQLMPSGNQTVRSFDLRNEAKGIYHIHVQTAEGNLTQRITLQ